MNWSSEDSQYDWLNSRYVESMRRNLGDEEARQRLRDEAEEERIQREVDEAMEEIGGEA